MKLIGYEWKKIKALKWLTVALVFLVLCGCLLPLVLEDQEETNWRSFAQEQRAELQSFMEQVDPEDPITQQAHTIFQEQMELIQYCLEHDIVYGVQSVWTYLQHSKFLLMIVTVVLIVLSGNAISVEYRCKMQEKILSEKNTVSKLLRTKLASLSTLVVLSYTVGAVFLFLIGMVWFGHTERTVTAKVIDGLVVQQELTWVLLKYFIVLIASTLIYVVLAVLLETLFPEKKLVSIGLILLLVFNGSLENLSRKLSMEQILPFYYLNTDNYISLHRVSDYCLQLGYLFALLFLLIVLAFYVYRKYQWKN